MPKNIVLQTHFAAELPQVFVNKVQLHQAVLSICINARDAMAKGGTLTISTSLADGAMVRTLFPNETAQHYIAIAVNDTGIGMSLAVKNRIFEPFFTTKGMANVKGLGLSIVHGIVTRNNGVINVASEEGNGTTFTLYFPAIEEEYDMQRYSNASSATSDAPRTILYVEDEEMLGVVAKPTLEETGYNVLWAKDGEQAVNLYKEHRNDIALVVTDLGLPKLGGWEVFEQIRAMNHKVKVIIATGFIAETLRRQMLENGACDIIQKPYRMDALIASVKKVLE